MPARLRSDACPGVFATHDAADGSLARVRLPGGSLTGAQARVLAACAADLGDGDLYLTSRANVQLRAVRDPDELVARLSDAGLLPAPGHERVRNILASPLSGVHGGLLDVRPLVTALDRAVCTAPALAQLPGRFLLALDDGRGDVATCGADVSWQALDATTGALLLAGADTGLRVAAHDAVVALVAVATAFEATRESAWRVAEAPAGPLATAARGLARGVTPTSLPTGSPPPVGVVGDAVVAAPVLGRVAGETLRTLAGHVDGLVVTPWRTLVLAGVDPAVPERLGLTVDPAAPSLDVSACIGRPGCAKSRADVRADALAVAGTGVRAHLSGCERRCGKPREPHADVVAEDGGYRVDGTVVPAADLIEALKGDR